MKPGREGMLAVACSIAGGCTRRGGGRVRGSSRGGVRAHPPPPPGPVIPRRVTEERTGNMAQWDKVTDRKED